MPDIKVARTIPAGPYWLLNSYFEPSGVRGISVGTSGGALTLSITSATISFRDPSLSNGDTVLLEIDSPLSSPLSSGSTLGTTSGVAFRLWMVLFNDGGTARLGLVNCRNGPSITRLREYGLMSSTAEGGAGGADSAGVIYTDVAVSSKPMRVLGYLEWTSGLATAGTWSAAPDVVQMLGPGVPLPGETVQIVGAKTTTQTSVTTSTYTDTLLTATIDLSSPSNAIGIAWGGTGGVDASNVQGWFGLHRGGSALQERRIYAQTGGVITQVVQTQMIDYPGVAGDQVYKVKIRNNTGATAVKFPYATGVDSAEMQVAEIMA